jgi:methyl coenzyme M reductase subunit C-like uncharacterized protein (methanogenesis marker protein 7)
MDSQKRIAQLQDQIKQILDQERQLNANDPAIVSLLTRIENRIAKAAEEIKQG